MLHAEHVQALAVSLRESEFLRQKREDAYACLTTAAKEEVHALDLPDHIVVTGHQCTSVACGLPEEASASGVTFEIFSQAFAHHESLLEEHFRQLLPAHSSLEAARHFAFLTGGFLLVIPPHITLALPISLTFLSRASWSAEHLLIVVGEGATVTITVMIANDLEGDDPSGREARGFTSHGTELFVADGADVEITCLERLDREARSWIAQRSLVGADARVHWCNATIGGAVVMQHLISRTVGVHATCAIDWLGYAKAQERHSLSAHNVFAARAGGGEITLKSVVEGRAHATLEGGIEITDSGSGTATYLTEKALMLDTTARCDAQPKLTIKTNDVKASHSASVTKVSAEDLFYFTARGITTIEARQMFIEGFLRDLTERFPRPEVREDICQAIARKYER